MGDVWMPDRAITIDQLLKALELLEEDWHEFEGDFEGQLKTALLATMLCVGFSGALRGKEIRRAELGLVRQNWEEALNHLRAPHVPWAMVGRFKNETGEKVFHQPFAVETKSGICNAKWIRWVIDLYARTGIITGPIFRLRNKPGSNVVRRCKPSDLDPEFHQLRMRVQVRWPDILPLSVDVSEEYKLR
eukprot:scaffold50453_cov30-Attheya_sp.AAC.2